MKKSLVILLIAICCHVHAQNYFSESFGTLKAGVGYAKDFPGLSGYAITGEYTYPLSENLEGGFGFKRLNMSGYPRTSTVNEYTRATTIDFNIYFLPIVNETNIFRIGAGYSFSFFRTRRSYPLAQTQGEQKMISWPVQDASGRLSGLIVTGEYEYLLSSNLSLGIKASLCKAYDRVFYIGPYVGIRL
ncbi:MAG: hypothetical protein H7122_16540 [Chitinophagaceae bacterium]|nr:hypothetical protein [Chitinophagaceae bacterium]